MMIKSQIIQEFQKAVNLSSLELENWLESDASKNVGQKLVEGQESIGHGSGVKIVALLQKQEAALSQEDLQHMQRVVSYIHRHLAQKPASSIVNSRWRYSLMNWGHDPLKNSKI